MKSAFDSRRERVAIFEDDGDTGYLYLYASKTQEIMKHLHLYDHNPQLALSSQDIEVLWSTDESKCSVEIWSEIRGIIDLRRNREGRAWLKDRTTPGIDDQDWLEGFERM